MTVGDLQDKIAGLDRSMQVLIPLPEHACSTGEYEDAIRSSVYLVLNKGGEYMKTQYAGGAKKALVIE